MIENPTPAGLSAHDAYFLSHRHGGPPMHVGGVTVAGQDAAGESLDPDTFGRHLGERLALLPRFRQRLRPSRWVAGQPAWTDVPDFDIDDHVFVEEPSRPGGSPEEQAAVVGRVFSQPLPGDRPLWRFHVVPGLDRGRSLVVFVASHALVDGMSGIEVARVLLSSRPVDEPASARKPWDRDEVADPGDVTPYLLAEDYGTWLRDGWRQVAGAIDPVPVLERRIEFLDGLISILDRGRRHRPRFVGSAPPRLRYAMTSYGEPRLRAFARISRVTLEQVLVAIAAGGVARLLDARGQVRRDETALALVPLARAHRRRRERLGNHASFLITALPIGPMTMRERLGRVAAELQDARTAGQGATSAMALDGLDRVPLGLSSMIAGLSASTPFVDMVVSFVRGPRRDLYLGPYPHLATHPVLPIAPHVHLSIGLNSLGGRVAVGISADAAAVPEVDFLTDAFDRSAAELLSPRG